MFGAVSAQHAQHCWLRLFVPTSQTVYCYLCSWPDELHKAVIMNLVIPGIPAEDHKSMLIPVLKHCNVGFGLRSRRVGGTQLT